MTPLSPMVMPLLGLINIVQSGQRRFTHPTTNPPHTFQVVQVKIKVLRLSRWKFRLVYVRHILQHIFLDPRF